MVKKHQNKSTIILSIMDMLKILIFLTLAWVPCISVARGRVNTFRCKVSLL